MSPADDAPEKAVQPREVDGRYAFIGRFERLCRCGHALGMHCAGTPQDCLAHTLAGASAVDRKCRCPKFRIAPLRAALAAVEENRG